MGCFTWTKPTINRAILNVEFYMIDALINHVKFNI